jgi:hypothetical protein
MALVHLIEIIVQINGDILLTRCSERFSKKDGRRRFLLAVLAIPPTLNKRSTAANDGSAILYFLKTSETRG